MRPNIGIKKITYKVSKELSFLVFNIHLYLGHICHFQHFLQSVHTHQPVQGKVVAFRENKKIEKKQECGTLAVTF